LLNGALASAHPGIPGSDTTHAATRTTISSSPGDGVAVSSMVMTSGGPNR
jgi:hypothetical protein